MNPMKKFAMIIIVINFLIIIGIWLGFSCLNRIQKVEVFKDIKIGQKCPGFFWIEDDLQSMRRQKPAKFFLIFISEEIITDPDSWELDDKKHYSHITEEITKKGGHFWPNKDGKVAMVFGIDYIQYGIKYPTVRIRNRIERFLYENGLIKERSSIWGLEESIIVVTDGHGKIMAIYKNAMLKDIKRVLADLKL